MREPAPAHEGYAGDQISLLICDDEHLFTDALSIIVKSHANVRLVADPVDNVIEAVAASARLQPDVVLMDLHLDGEMTGMVATRRIRAASPDTRIVITTDDGSDEVLLEAIEAGASGVLAKSETVDGALAAVEAAARNEWLIDLQELPLLVEDAAREREARLEGKQRLGRLTDREREVLQLLQDGAGTSEIAEHLYISRLTVGTHVQNIFRKLNVHSKLEAVAFARRSGWLRR